MYCFQIVISNYTCAATPRLQNQLREAGALPALIRVTARMNGEGQGGGQGGGAGQVEVAAVLAALTNLANGNPVNQGRLRQEAGLMEAGRRATRDLRSFPGCLKWRSPILEKYTVESPHGTITWQI
jgi:hypothetical protein